MEVMACPAMAVPPHVMQHVVRVESSFNPYAIGVVGGRLVRQPKNLVEAVATARMLEARGYNFSLGLAQVNRYNLAKYGLASYEQAFERCPNLQAGSRILAECKSRSGGDWGKAFSCYYSGNFTTGFRHGYVQKVFASMQAATPSAPSAGYPGAIPLAAGSAPRAPKPRTAATPRRASALPAAAATWSRRIVPASAAPTTPIASAPAPAMAGPAAPTPATAAPAADGVAVLSPSGPPTLVPATPAPASAAPRIEAAPSDAAFVF
ncbi:lytic transglycosylase domain-containing protein [Lysobacter humi (ex Lee et al. 2017)]